MEVETAENIETQLTGHPAEGKPIVTVDNTEEAPKKEAKKEEPNPLLDAIKALQSEIKGLKQTNQPKPQPKPKADPVEPDWDALWFENPKEAAKLIREQIRAEMDEEKAVQAAQVEQQQVIGRFWQDFAKEYPHLSDEDTMALVEAEMSKSWNKIKDLEFADARKELAELTQKRMLRMLKKGEGSPKDHRTHTEGSPVKLSMGGGEESPKVVSLSTVISRMQARQTKGR